MKLAAFIFSLTLFGNSAGAVGCGTDALEPSSPETIELRQFYEALKATSNRLAIDFKEILKSYYELKKQSANPHFAEPLSEFTYAELATFRDELLRRHPDNLYLQMSEEYKIGRANDIFQKVTTRVWLQFNRKPNITKLATTLTWVRQLNMDRNHLIFREVSVQFGYVENGVSPENEIALRAKIIFDRKSRNEAAEKEFQKRQATLSL